MSPDPDLLARLRSGLPDHAARFAEHTLVRPPWEPDLIADAARQDASVVLRILERYFDPPPPLPLLADILAGAVASAPLPALQSLHVADPELHALRQELARWIIQQAEDVLPPDALAGGGPPPDRWAMIGDREEVAADEPTLMDLGATRGGRRPDPAPPSPPKPAARRTASPSPMHGSGSGDSDDAPPSPGDTAGDAGDGPGDKVPAVVSADAPSRLQTGAEGGVKVRIERKDGARPLAHATTALMETRGLIAVILTIQGEAIALTDQAMLKSVDPPGPGEAAEVEFGIRGVQPGTARLVIHLQQGSARLAMLELTVKVASSAADEARRTVEAEASEADGGTDEVLEIIIQEDRDGDGVFYTYLVNSRRLDVAWGKFHSPRFEAVTAGGASASRGFVETIYRRIETEVLENWDDADLLARRLQGIGVTLCDQLFPPELARLLWEGRDRIGSVEVTPFEPWIPWELLRLRKPGTSGTAGVDERFFAEYRLLRTLSGRWPAGRLGANRWRYVLGRYPHGLYQPAAGERAFLEQTLPNMGVPVDTVEPDPTAVLQAMEDPDFDVLHFACHGSSDLEHIEASSLVLSDREVGDGTVRPVTLTPTDLAGATNLQKRRPLVFLNACQSGRQAPVLTDLGGWPKAFLDAGAGAVMGTLWSVHEKPAVSFAETFYRRLLDGVTLAEATGDARTEAKQHGDATWLAYTAYGSPTARIDT